MIYLLTVIGIGLTGLLARRFGILPLLTYHPLLAVLGILFLGYKTKQLNNLYPESTSLRKGALLIAFLTLFSGLGAQMNLTSLSLHQAFILLLLLISVLVTTKQKQ